MTTIVNEKVLLLKYDTNTERETHSLNEHTYREQSGGRERERSYTENVMLCCSEFNGIET